MKQKNNISFMLFFTLTISFSHPLYSMFNSQQKLQQQKTDRLEQKKILLAQQKKLDELKIEEQDEEIRFKKEKKELRETQNKQELLNEQIRLDKEKINLEREQKILDEQRKQEERRNNLEKIEDEKKAEELKQTQASTQNAINNNNATRQIGITAVKSFTDGTGTGVGNSIVALVQKELEYLYSQHRPTQATLLAEVDAASKIIRQGIDNIAENYERQLKLINSSNKNQKAIDEEIRTLKKETYNAYETLREMENESRRRLQESYGYRNTEFKNKINNKSTTNIFDTPTESDNKNQNSSATQKPNRVKRIADFITKKTCLMADAIANTLPINSQLDQITQSEQLKNSWINTYKTEISRVAALGLVATSLAILYKSYSWYYNEERLAACEAVAQLEEQKEQIALQFKQEMAKPTMSAQDKIKLQNAYDNYMQQLQEEIDEQRAIAGYNIPKKLLMGSLIATSGVAGIVACARYYLSTKAANGTLGIPSVTNESTNNDTQVKTDVQPNTNDANGTKIDVEQPSNNSSNVNNSNSDNEKEPNAKSFPRPNFKGLV